MMLFARRRVFISQPDGEFLMISALAWCVEITRFRASDNEFIGSTFVEPSAVALGLFDGKGWKLVKLVGWLKNDLRTCPICGRAVTNRRAKYDRAKCRQAAYRKRRK